MTNYCSRRKRKIFMDASNENRRPYKSATKKKSYGVKSQERKKKRKEEYSSFLPA
jgi:hypothetical protein